MISIVWRRGVCGISLNPLWVCNRQKVMKPCHKGALNIIECYHRMRSQNTPAKYTRMNIPLEYTLRKKILVKYTRRTSPQNTPRDYTHTIYTHIKYTSKINPDNTPIEYTHRVQPQNTAIENTPTEEHTRKKEKINPTMNVQGALHHSPLLTYCVLPRTHADIRHLFERSPPGLLLP